MAGKRRKQPLILLEDIQKTYVTGEIVTPVLKGVSLAINEGEFVALMGPSGSGKSTLMHLIGFLDRLTAGQYRYRGKPVGNFEDDALALMRRFEVGFVFQFFNLLPKSTVLENVMLPLLYQRVPHALRRAKAMKALESVGLLHRADYLSNQISGGERQRVAIARALVADPKVILADEPTGNLDSKSGLEVLKLFAKLHKMGHTVVMVTHEMSAARFAKRIIELKDGEIISDQKNGKHLAGSYSK